MHNSRTCKHALASWILLGVMFVCWPSAGAHAEEAVSNDTPAMGELRIEGEHISRLILSDSRGEQQVFPEPGSSVTLAAGDYHLQEITLQGGHSCQLGQLPADSRVTVDANAPATLKAGAPLRQVVEIRRQGTAIVLNYELIGQGGERYSINRTQGSPAPSFAVYRGDRKVASADFEYG